MFEKIDKRFEYLLDILFKNRVDVEIVKKAYAKAKPTINGANTCTHLTIIPHHKLILFIPKYNNTIKNAIFIIP